MSFDTPLIECVPNFSVGFDGPTLKAIKKAITSVPGVKLLHEDIGPSANRTVLTFMGIPSAVEEAAFQAVKTAGQHIDMSQHKGAHPRIGATDVLPLVPVHGVTLQEVVTMAHRLGQRIGQELGIPGYFYEAAATAPARQRLEWCRSGEYEGLEQKMAHPDWAVDFGPKSFSDQVARTGATMISARNFLIAWNVNLDTNDVRIAKQIAGKIRESGTNIRQPNGDLVHQPGQFKDLKAIGWYLENFDLVQISMNLTNHQVTGLFEVYECIKGLARDMGTKVTGSELVGLIPQDVLSTCGKKAEASGLIDSSDLQSTADYLGLSQLFPFEIDKRVLEQVFARQS